MEKASILQEICLAHNTHGEMEGGERESRREEEEKKNQSMPPVLKRLPSVICIVPRSEWFREKRKWSALKKKKRKDRKK